MPMKRLVTVVMLMTLWSVAAVGIAQVGTWKAGWRRRRQRLHRKETGFFRPKLLFCGSAATVTEPAGSREVPPAIFGPIYFCIRFPLAVAFVKEEALEAF